MTTLLFIVFETLYIFSPAILGNMAPIFAAYYNWFPSLARPADFNKKFNHVRILGDNKTIRGFLLSIIIGFIVGLFQYFLITNVPLANTYLLTNNSFATTIISAITISFGALLGDAVGSFIKRQLHIPPGSSFPVVDQIDYIVGALFFAVIFFPITTAHILTAFMLLGPGSFVTSIIGKQLGLKNNF